MASRAVAVTGSARPAPRRGSLSRDLVVGTALRLIDERGLDALSMRALGAELGVEAMSLYNHVPSKAALLDAVVERMLAEFSSEPLPPGGWEASIAEFARRYRRLARRHPEAFALLVQRPERSYTVGREVVESALGALVAAGLAPSRAAQALRTIVLFVIGLALTDRATAAPAPGGPAPPPPARGEFPLVAELMERLPRGRDEDLFEFGLAVILRGVAAEAAAGSG